MERTTLTERLRRVEAEIAAGHPEQALAYCQDLQAAYPRALRVQRVLGEIYLALHRPREALAALDRTLAGDPEDVRACCARALVHQMHGDDTAALAWYRRACDLRPDDQSLRLTYRDLAHRLREPSYRPSRAGLARLYLRGDLFAHAIREWEQLVNESPDMLDAQVGLAETLWLAGHTRVAEERCLRILANAPSCVKAMLILMALSLADGDMDSARAHLQRTLQLDPDMSIAQVFFADALASGDPVLIPLLRADAGAEFSDETMKLSRQTAGFAQSAPISGQRNLSRPLVTSAPATSGPVFGAPQPSSQPLPPPPRPDIPVPSQPTQVTRAFKETAFMIWAQDEDSQPRLPAQHAAAAGEANAAASALRDLDSTADDDETRRALNWYNWLQSQGAVALGSAPAMPAMPGPPPESAPAPAKGPTIPLPGADVPVDAPAAPPGVANGHPAAAAGGSGGAGGVGGPRFTMPLPPAQQSDLLFPAAPSGAQPQTQPQTQSQEEDEEQATIPLPSSQALRTMFAELGGNTSSQPVVEAGTVASAPAAETPDTRDATYETYETHDEYVEAGNAPNIPQDSFVADDDSQYEDQYDDDGDDQPHGAQTLEDLERQFSASGFTHIETRHGLLAELDRGQQAGDVEVAVPPPTDDEPARDEPSGGDEPERVPVVSGPDPRDYPARLTRARQRRDGGQLDEALNEYRVIIKNAPDLLPDVLDDLYASLAELPDHPNLHSVLGDALVCQGEYEKALESYNKAMELAQARSGQS
ncbi:MAG TPA: tetratricopeptide repeat protein [Ktedonobacterales bacterium]|nr:tetratricopeptide repeat protein [Ktedonobacterales bacterium]